jgi:hypothetical protein
MRSRKREGPSASRTDGLQQYTKLENRLVLLAWLNSLLGYERTGNCSKIPKPSPRALARTGAVFSPIT